MAYHIQLPQFEGPLELLLALIEKQKLDVTRVSLAQITDQYLEYIAKENAISLENLAWFLVIASRLILIKSKALLPLLTFDDEEEQEMEDLEFQLQEYKKFKDISLRLSGIVDAHNAMYGREGSFLVQSLFYPPQSVTPESLRLHFEKVLRDIPVLAKLEETIVEEVITIEERIISLQEMLRHKVSTSFAEMTAHAKDKVEVIVSFLAMLELIKQRLVHVDQSGGLFTDIQLKKISS